MTILGAFYGHILVSYLTECFSVSMWNQMLGWKEFQGQICGEALRLRRRERQKDPESGDGGLHGGWKLHGDGDGADQGS